MTIERDRRRDRPPRRVDGNAHRHGRRRAPRTARTRPCTSPSRATSLNAAGELLVTRRALDEADLARRLDQLVLRSSAPRRAAARRRASARRLRARHRARPTSSSPSPCSATGRPTRRHRRERDLPRVHRRHRRRARPESARGRRVRVGRTRRRSAAPSRGRRGRSARGWCCRSRSWSSSVTDVVDCRDRRRARGRSSPTRECAPAVSAPHYAALWESLEQAELGRQAASAPRLVLAAYRGSAAPTRALATRVAVAFELLHTAFIIHDDVIDRDDRAARRRRTSPARSRPRAIAHGADDARERRLGRDGRRARRRPRAQPGAPRDRAAAGRRPIVRGAPARHPRRAVFVSAAGELADVVHAGSRRAAPSVDRRARDARAEDRRLLVRVPAAGRRRPRRRDRGAPSPPSAVRSARRHRVPARRRPARRLRRRGRDRARPRRPTCARASARCSSRTPRPRPSWPRDRRRPRRPRPRPTPRPTRSATRCSASAAPKPRRGARARSTSTLARLELDDGRPPGRAARASSATVAQAGRGA